MKTKIQLGIYPRTLFICTEETPEAMTEWLNGNGHEPIPPIDDSSTAFVFPVTDGINGGPLIYFENLSEMANPATVAHECYHATMMMASYLGLGIQPDHRNEHIAYLLGWCVQQVHNFYNEIVEQKSKEHGTYKQ